MERLVYLLVSGLAVFRLAEMLVLEDGPGQIFMRLRSWFNRGSFVDFSLRRQISGVFSCVYCMGVWLALIPPLFFASTSLSDFVLFWLAIAGLQSILAAQFGRQRHMK